MKHTFKTAGFPGTALLAVGILMALLLSACPTEGNDDPVLAVAQDGAFLGLVFQTASEPASVPPNIKYYSLSQGVELAASKRNTAEWDIAVEAIAAFCYIYTNSGVTATEFGSGGKGGVWFVDTADYDEVVSPDDRVTDYTGKWADYADCKVYETDVIRYQTAMSTIDGCKMNIMTYYGYHAGDGLSQETAFDWSDPGPPTYPFFDFNKKAFNYANGGMPPPWFPTKNIYVIRHGDGKGYSKLQVTEYKYVPGYKHQFGFRFASLDG